MRVTRGEEEEEGASSGDEESGRWGRKSAYYDADAADLEASDEEEALENEEAEAKRLQREALRTMEPEDYGLGEGEGEDGEGKEGEGTLGERAARSGGATEFLPEDVEGMSAAERLAAVERSAPELKSLLDELRGSVAEVRSRVGPVLAELRSGGLGTAEGLSFLDAKQLLLTQYAACLTFYLLLKAEGRRVAGHPVVERLVTLRAWLEKVRPIDKKLEYQVSKLLAAAVAARDLSTEGELLEAEERDALRSAPRPESLSFGGEEGAVLAAGADEEDEGDEGAGEEDGVYRAPKRRSMVMDPDGKEAREARRAAQRAAQRASRSTLLNDLARELAGAPEESRGATATVESKEAERAARWASERAEIEEDLMVRVPLSREERRRAKAQQRAGVVGAAALDDLGGDLGGILGSGAGPLPGFSAHTKSQRFGAHAPADGSAARSGDADLPAREPLAVRRARVDDARARRAAAAEESDEGAPRGRSGRREGEGEEDEFYAAAKERKARVERERADEAERRFPKAQPPAPEKRTPGARPIGRAIEKNRGLVAHKKKSYSDPRKKHRVRYEKALVRRHGQVQEVRERSAAYGGEATGIKSGISKSVKF